LIQITEDMVAAALGWSCDICGATEGNLCTNPIAAGEPLPGRQVHFGRLMDRRSR
jgi:hypothetical protein